MRKGEHYMKFYLYFLSMLVCDLMVVVSAFGVIFTAYELIYEIAFISAAIFFAWLSFKLLDKIKQIIYEERRSRK